SRTASMAPAAGTSKCTRRKKRPVSASPNCCASTMLQPCSNSSPETRWTMPVRSGQERVRTWSRDIAGAAACGRATMSHAPRARCVGCGRNRGVAPLQAGLALHRILVQRFVELVDDGGPLRVGADALGQELALAVVPERGLVDMHGA